MKVFIAGATGVLGRRLIRQFRARGCEVSALARSERGTMLIRALGGEPRPGDLFDSDSLARAAEGAEVIIHAATSIPTRPKTSPQDWEMNDRIRRGGTRALTSCAARVGARVYLQQSITWVARPADGSPFDEDSPPCPDIITQSALDGELIAREAGERTGFRVAILRCGYFYSPDAGHTRMMGERLRKRGLPIFGAGDAVWTMLHAEDAAGAFVAAAEAGRSGLWHIVDDEPVSVAKFLRFFAQCLHAPQPYRIPAWLGRLLAGGAAVKYFQTSTTTQNQRFRREVGWQPGFPTYRGGLQQVAAAWEEEARAGARGAST